MYNVQTGAEVNTLTPTESSAGDEFGFAVAISGSTAAIGSTFGGSGEGAAYIMNALTGTQLPQLRASDGFPGNEFGYNVAIDGSRAVIGSPTNPNVSPARAGKAYVIDAATGDELRILQASDAAPDDEFGFAVAVSGNRAIVAAPHRGVGQGAAYIYNLTTGAETPLLPPTSVASDDFGFTVDIEGDLAMVGSPAGGGVTNRAYLYDANTGAFLRELVRSAGGSNDEFGFTVALDEHAAVSGAPLVDTSAGANAGGPMSFAVWQATSTATAC